ncbi:MAG: CBS domain-containing protein [Planctomycetota bacterium]|nr:MAG: CBS domain-containing protein [Planctomycetota bacterium]
MAASQTEIESQVAELSTMAFEAFCADISVMFGLEAQCIQQQVATATIEELKKAFAKLAAVVSVEAKGTLDGTFQLALDRAGLFTLAGITFPLTQEQILKKTKDGSTKDAKALSNALADAAKIIIEAWDKLFHEKLSGHDQLMQADIFIGNPWDKPQEKISMAADEECLSVLCEVTVGPYPTFNCAAIFPKTIVAGPPEQQTETQQETDSEADDKTGQAAQNESEDKAQDQTESQADQKAEPQAQEKPPAAAEEKIEPQAQEEPAAAPEEKAVLSPDEQTEPQAEDQPAPEPEQKVTEQNEQAPAGDSKPLAMTDEDEKLSAETKNTANEQTEPAAEPQSPDTDVDSSADAPEEKVPPDESPSHPVSDAIRSITGPSTESLSEPELHGPPDSAPHTPCPSLKIRAKEIMQKDVSWAGPEDSIQDALAMLQQNDAGYLMVGTDGKLEGLVSRSDVNGALSPYLQPMFAKWRRPLDDATLQIKIKWIMTRTIRTVNPDTPLAAIMEIMCQFGWRALPVIDHQGGVQGLVTVFDIFRALLRADSNTSAVGTSLQAPLLA